MLVFHLQHIRKIVGFLPRYRNIALSVNFITQVGIMPVKVIDVAQELFKNHVTRIRFIRYGTKVSRRNLNHRDNAAVSLDIISDNIDNTYIWLIKRFFHNDM